MGEEGGGIKPEAKLPAVVPSAKPPPAHPKVQGATRGWGPRYGDPGMRTQGWGPRDEDPGMGTQG